MTYLYLKSLHIIFVVTWFAGLFYMVRLFIYTTEAHQKTEPDRSILLQQLLMMQTRLWMIISWPSALLTLVFGTWLAIESSFWIQPWFHLKLLFVGGLFLYHLICHKLYRQMKKDVYKFSSTQLRLWNEVATLFLFAIVFIVVLKSTLNWLWGIGGLVLIGILLMLGIKIYKKFRNVSK
ncbi:MAG: CopD family protein [Reichenbachiella sp.]|uniref:CopD family protein n=1 Tax=Reichenbachiella sp. TaxID=2184521 RepID=UPI0032639B17